MDEYLDVISPAISGRVVTRSINFSEPGGVDLALVFLLQCDKNEEFRRYYLHLVDTGYIGAILHLILKYQSPELFKWTMDTFRYHCKEIRCNIVQNFGQTYIRFYMRARTISVIYMEDKCIDEFLEERGFVADPTWRYRYPAELEKM